MSVFDRPVMILCGTELRTLLRDRRAVVLAIVLPLIVMPAMLFASHWVEERRTHQLGLRPVTFAVGGERPDELRDLLAKARDLQAPATSPVVPAVTLVELAVSGGLAGALERAEIDFFIEGFVTTEPPQGIPGVRLVFRSDRDISRRAVEHLASNLERIRQSGQFALLAREGVSLQPFITNPPGAIDLAPAAETAGLALGRVATLLLLFLLFSGGALVAQDTLAGEKERGTLETLLTTAVTRREIVAAKVLLVFIVALTITGVQVANLLVYVGFQLVPASQNLAAAVGPGLALGLLVFLLPLAALIAGLLVLVSGYSRTHREAQLYFLPLLLAGAVPAAAAFLPAVSLRSALLLVPVANISIGVKELLVGRIDLPFLIGAWLVTAAAAVATMVAATRVLSSERLIVPATDHRRKTGAATSVRPGQLATWFGAMWAIVFLISTNLGTGFDIRGQLFINLVVVFLGGSFLFIRHFQLSIKETLSLRMPHRAVWVAVALGIPSGLVTGIGLFRLSQTVLPVPPELLRAFAQYFAPDTIPWWQMLPMMTLLPGVCEEIAFRGVLLHGLRSHFSRPVTIALVGVAFGLFHFSVFRIAQTAYLGVLLATITMMSGSLFPAMVWHAGSNALALAIGRTDFQPDRLHPSSYGVASVVLAASLWLVWRVGATPRTRGRHGLLLTLVILGVALNPWSAAAQGSLAEGRAALGRGDVRRAITTADAVLLKTPLSEDALALKIDALASANDWETALDAYERFLNAGGSEQPDLLQVIGSASLREAIAFFPTIRQLALSRLACGGDRDALLELRRMPPPRPDDIDAHLTRAKLGDFTAVNSLRDLVSGGTPSNRILALQALAQLKDRGAADATRDALRHPDGSVRLAAARLARVAGPAGLEPELRLLVGDPNPLIAAEATAALAIVGDQVAVGRLPALIASPVPEVRLAALAAQLEHGATPAVVDGLTGVARIRTSSAWTSAVELLVRADSRAGASVLREAFEDASPSVRIQALRLASLLPMNELGDFAPFRRWLRDPNTFVRLETAAILATRSRMCGT